MNRQSFGTWGVELTDGEFAQALASVGVLMWRGLGSLSTAEGVARALSQALPADFAPVQLYWDRWYPEWERLELPPARALAEGWRRSSLPGRVRLEIPGQRDYWRSDRWSMAWVVDQLSRAEVGARSVYVRIDEAEEEVGWQWPLRIGFLRDPRSAALRAELDRRREEVQWLQPLIEFVDAEGAGGASDILLLPSDLQTALASVAALPSAPQADAVVVLGRLRGGEERWYPQVLALRATARTSGVALSHVPVESEADWFKALVTELSHNQPLDVALYSASMVVEASGREREQPPHPILVSSRRLVEFSQLANQVRRMADRFSSPDLREKVVEVAPGSSAERNLRLAPGPHRFELVAERMRRVSEEDVYLRESDMATAVSELAAGARAAEAERPAAEPRFIQAQVYEVTERQEPVPRSRSFRAGSPHVVVVRVGVIEEGWMVDPLLRPFPSEALPENQDEHLLTVVLTEPRLLAEPQVTRVVLPQRGSSSEARFYLFPPLEPEAGGERIERVEGRIVVLYRNRVLQTALLSGPIVAGPDEGGAGGPMVEVEAVVRRSLEDLTWRQPFDAALVLNHARNGTPGISAFEDGTARYFRVSDGMRVMMRWFDERLSSVARAADRDPGAFSRLEAEDTVGLLRDFARNGARLYQYLLDQGVAGGGLAHGTRLQVVSALPEARLPAEFVYDRPTPKTDASLCPNAVDALHAGACMATCSHGPSAGDFVCPLGFWGLSRVLERHRHDPERRQQMAGEDFAFLPEAVRGRAELDVLRSGLVGGSHRVQRAVPDGLERICEHVTGGTRSPSEPILAWEAWRSRVGEGDPSLLVLVVHTGVSPTNHVMERMEIGTEDWLETGDLNGEYIRPGEGPGGPLVLLLGCETGDPTVDFAGLVTECRRAGAAIVVATGAKIHALHAVPVAEAFVDALVEALGRGDGAPVTFGEVMRDVRQKMVARGIPMALTLTAYGDAEWRLRPLPVA